MKYKRGTLSFIHQCMLKKSLKSYESEQVKMHRVIFRRSCVSPIIFQCILPSCKIWLFFQQVSRVFDEACSRLLNTGFSRLQTKMMQRFQSIKSRMPRRESARRNHPLACESDIVETVHMRLTLLHMTFGKHIERRHCCFFPGEVTSNNN
jgi:hypothetical protein